MAPIRFHEAVKCGLAGLKSTWSMRMSLPPNRYLLEFAQSIKVVAMKQSEEEC